MSQKVVSPTALPSESRLKMLADFVDIVRLLADSQLTTVVSRLTQPGFDHQAFWDFLMAEKVTDVVVGTLGQNEVQSVFPQPYAHWFDYHLNYECERKANLWLDLCEIVDALENYETPVMVLKGFVLGQLLYHDPACRHQSDLDLLVRRSDLARSVDLLQNHGFSLSRGRKRISRSQLRTEHAVTMTRGRTKVDIHWCLRQAPAYRIDEDQVWACCQRVAVRGRSWKSPSCSWILALLLTSLVHDLGRGAGRLKHLLDIYLLLQQHGSGISWRQFLNLRQTEGTLKPCINALKLVSDLFGNEAIPSKLAEELDTHQSLVRVKGTGHSLFLLDQPRRSIHSALWFCQAYPTDFRRDLIYLLDRTLQHPGRVPLMIYRVLQRSWQLAVYASTSLWRIDPSYSAISKS